MLGSDKKQNYSRHIMTNKCRELKSLLLINAAFMQRPLTTNSQLFCAKPEFKGTVSRKSW
jgi:hypothetical protein